MSTIKSSDEHLTLNADGSSKDIKFQANGVQKASISSAGAFTSTTIDATALTGALPALDGSSLTGVGGGITEIDTWRLHTSLSGDARPLTANLERDDTTLQSFLGTGMTESGGEFTFPSTGHWQITGSFYILYNGDSSYNTAGIEVSTDDGSSWTGHTAEGVCFTVTGGSQVTAWVQYIMDVTDIGNTKVRFSLQSAESASIQIYASSNSNRTAFQFLKLGDT